MRPYLRFLRDPYLFLVVAVIVGYVALRQQAAATHKAVCRIDAVLLAKAKKDRAGAEAILAANPNGVPGFTRPTILAAIQDDKDMILATTDETCEP